MTDPVRIVILGGGFGGVFTARSVLRHARRADVRVEVHLVNRENYLVFQPMLPEVISGSVGIADTVSPIRRLVPGVILHTRDVEGVDLERREVICSAGLRPRTLVLPYDHLVVALGNLTDFRGMTGLAEHAMPFKTLGDALTLRNHVIRLLEEADTEPDPAVRAQFLTFVAAGGGFSGVEVIAELQDFVRRAIRSFPRLKLADCRFVLIHSRDRILPEVEEALALYAQRLLRRRGVEILLNQRLASATANQALLADGTPILTKTLVATVPSHPSPVVEAIARDLNFVTVGKDGKPRVEERLRVESTLRVEGATQVWALGDCASIPLTGGAPAADPRKAERVPPTAQHAIREAELCGRNIVRSQRGQPLRPFTFTGLGSLAALGGHRGVAQVLGVKVSGFLAWVLWRAVYLSKLPGLDRKVRVGLSWVLDLIFPPDIVQLRLRPRDGIRQEHFEAGQTVFEQGDVGDRVYVIIKGRAEAWRREDRDAEPRKLREMASGDYFGELAVLHREPRSATIRCVEPVDLLSIPKADFKLLHDSLDALRKDISLTVERRARRTPTAPSLASVQATPEKL